MKKIIMGLFLLLCIFSIEKVCAQTYKLTLDKQSGIYYYRENDNSPLKTYQYIIYKLNDIRAYCIDPTRDITTFTYKDSGEFINLNYSDEVKEKLELIAYYGRDYPNHDNVRYSMAAQALIWEQTGTGKVTFWTKLNKEGTEIDVSEEKNEIMDLVNSHQKLPNINKEIVGYYNEEIIINDSILNEFYISDYGTNNNDDIVIKNNSLIIKSKNIGKSSITLTRKKYDDNKSIVFVGNNKNNSQTLARLRFNNDISFNINLDIKGVKIKIIKTDYDNNTLSIPNIKFKIKDLNSNNYICENSECIYSTNEKGMILTKGLNFGIYEIEEVEDQIIKGYTWNNNKYQVEIKEENLLYSENEGCYVKIFFPNKKINGIVKIFKKGEELIVKDNEINYQEKSLEGIKFLLYDENNNYIDSLVTNSNGYIEYEGLTVGKYYLIEKNTDYNYINDNKKYYFEIKQENQYQETIEVNLNINNYLKKGTLDFTKSDLVTSEGIPNTIIEIYNEKNDLLLTRETDNNGKVIIKKLPVGKYYIIEKEANELYQLTNEKVYFEILEDGVVIKANMINERKTIKVPKTLRNDNNIVLGISAFLLTIGFGGLIYETKKAY